ncbi:hypothetical protein [Vibrio scophthalmi]|uniref:Uncharacterized protein n=1 Tax=Vibrio scophthalmi TaxID=45658 RepID=A0A1E3WKZ3_9VIBR|nr:hypothetical protein [Vibrio scophthalmi]ODS10167.1 hypothetical protein VSF3289_00422 [Vibrio scophthalmi]
MKRFKQSSTWRGLALVGSAAALVSGNGHLFTAEVTDAGMQFGGVVGALVVAAIGVYDAIRDEFKGA